MAQKTWTGAVSTDWNNGANWSGLPAGVPGAADAVIIPNLGTANGSAPTVTADAQCASLTINGGGNNCTLTINTAVTLTVSGATTISPPTADNRTKLIAVGAGAFETGSLTMTAGGSATRVSRLTISTGTVTVAGAISLAANANDQIVFNNNGTLNVGGNFSSGATFTASTGTVVYNGSNQTACGSYIYNNLTLTGTNTKTFPSSPTVGGILSVEGDATVNPFVTGAGVITYGANATLRYNKSANFTATDEEWITPFNGLGGVVIAGNTVFMNVAKQLGNNQDVPLTINTGATLNTNNNALTFHGDFINDGTFTAGSSNITIGGNINNQLIDGFTTTGTVSMTKTGNTATLQGNVNGGALTINGTGGTIHLGTNLTHTFTGTLTGTAGTFNGGSSLLRIGGDVTGSGGTFVASTSTIEYYASAPQTAGPVVYNNLIVSGSGNKTFATTPTVNGYLSMEGTANVIVTTGVVTYGASASLRYNRTTNYTATDEEWITPFAGTGGVAINNTGIITMNNAKQIGNNTSALLSIATGATLNTNNFDLTLHGSFTNSGNFVAGSSNIIIAGTVATQGIFGFSTTGNVSMIKTSGTATLFGNVTANTLIINGTGGTLNLGTGLTHNITDWTRTAGTLNGGAASTLRINGAVSGTGGTFTAGTGTVEYNAAGPQTATGVTYNNLILSGSGVKTLQTGTTTLNGSLTLSGTVSTTAVVGLAINGALTIGAGTTFNGAGFSHSVGGDWTNNGTFNNGGAGTITLGGTTQNVTGATPTTFNYLTISGGGTTTFTTQVTVTNDLTIAAATIVNLGASTAHSSNRLFFSTTGQPAGTHGGTGSGAANINTTFFAAAAGRLNVAVRAPATYYSRQTGNWNAPATWSTITYGNATNYGTFPVAGDAVNIGGGDFTITVNVTSACASLSYIASSNITTLVTQNTGTTLTVSGTVDIAASAINGGAFNTLAVNDGTLNAGAISFSPGGIFGGGGRQALTISTGTVNVGNFSQGGQLLATTNLTFTGPGRLNISGTCTNFNSVLVNFTPSTSTVEYLGAVPQEMANFNYYHLIISGTGAKTTVAGMNIDGNFTMSAGTSFTAGGNEHTIAGTWINNGTTFNNAGSTITFDGGNQTIGGTTATNFNNLTFAGTGTKTFSFASANEGLLTINNGILANMAANNHSARALIMQNTGQAPSTYGSTASAAAVKNNAVFTPGTTGILNVSGRAFFTRQSGTWVNGNTWSLTAFNGGAAGMSPIASDVVNIGGGNYTVTINANADCYSLNFASGYSEDMTVSMNNITLNATTVNIAGGGDFLSTETNTLAVGQGTLNVGNLIFGVGASLAGAHALTISTGLVNVTGDVTQSYPNADISISGAGTLRLRGAFLNSSNCDLNAATASTVEYIATTKAQQIGDFDYGNLLLNNTFATTPQFSLVGATSARGLNMTSGIVNMNGNTFTLGASGATSTLTRTASTTNNWMYGGTFLRFWPTLQTPNTAGNAYGLFPIGHSTTDYRPVTVVGTANISTTGSISFRHVNATTSTNLNPVYDDDPTAGVLNIVRKNEAQFIGTVAGGLASGGTFTVSASMTNLLSTGNLTDIRMAVSNGTTTVTNVGTHVASTGTVSAPTVARSGVAVGGLTGDFRVVSTNLATTLPITLRYFGARIEEETVKTEWATASEYNNHFFTIQKTNDFETFYDAGEIEGQGNSHEEHAYSFIDQFPISGRSYYRLKQTDFDGKVTYSEPVMINFEGGKVPALSVYPNPSQGNDVTLQISGLSEGTDVPVVIYNLLGEKIYDTVLKQDAPGLIQKKLDLNVTLPKGHYIVKAGKTMMLTKKLVVN